MQINVMDMAENMSNWMKGRTQVASQGDSIYSAPEDWPDVEKAQEGQISVFFDRLVIWVVMWILLIFKS